MPRPNAGPRLKLRRDKRWAESIWIIRWTENGRTLEKSTGFNAADIGQAQEYFRAWLNERRRTERAGPRDPAEIRVCDVLEDYAQEHGGDVASPSTLAASIEPLMAFFQGDTIATLTPERVKEFWEWRRRYSVHALNRERTEIEIVEHGAGDGTIIRELAGALRPAIRHAIEQRRLAPGEYYIPVPTAPRGRDYWITRPEAARLLWETRRDWRARLYLPLYTMIGLYTGARRGAILDLTWRQVDLVRGRIDFNPRATSLIDALSVELVDRQSVDQASVGRRRRAETTKRRPHIPVPRPLLAALRRAHARASSPYVIAYQGRRLASVKRSFGAAAERASLPDCTSHTLRHTAGTWMAQRGVSMREIGGYLGHSEARTTELYAHHHPDYMKAARVAMERKR